MSFLSFLFGNKDKRVLRQLESLVNSINNLEENSIDFYASVKSLYLQDRRKKILNADDITETQDDSDWEEIETQ